MEEDMRRRSPQESMSVSEAAEFLGVTEDAVRKRIRRGKIRYDRDPDGRYLVYPTEDDIRQTTDRNYVQPESSALIFELRAQIERLEDQLQKADERDRENRRLLAAALERIPPQLEAPSEPRESPETATGERQSTTLKAFRRVHRGPGGGGGSGEQTEKRTEERSVGGGGGGVGSENHGRDLPGVAQIER